MNYNFDFHPRERVFRKVLMGFMNLTHHEFKNKRPADSFCGTEREKFIEEALEKSTLLYFQKLLADAQLGKRNHYIDRQELAKDLKEQYLVGVYPELEDRARKLFEFTARRAGRRKIEVDKVQDV